MGESGKLRDERFLTRLARPRKHDAGATYHSAGQALLEVSVDCLLDVSLGSSLAKSGTRSNIVDVLLDMGWDVILLGGNIIGPGDMLPDEELSKE